MSDAMIYKAMCDAMADIGAVGKDQTNQQQHFRYRGIDDAMNALYPVLAKHGLFLTPEVLEQRREERTTKNGGNLIYSILKVKYTMYARDGSNVSAIVIGEGMDSADKSSNKAIAAAMKYAIFQMFCIPTEDMRDNDPDKETPPESTPRQQEPRASISMGERVPPQRYDHKPELNALLQKMNANMQDFARMRQALIDGGVLPDMKSSDMGEEDWKCVFRAIEHNFFPDEGAA